jgi:hypothetical protein
MKADGSERARMAAKAATGLLLLGAGLRTVARVTKFSSLLFSSPSVKKTVSLITASGSSGTLTYCYDVHNFNGKTFCVYVDRVIANGSLMNSVNSPTATSGLIHQSLSILKQQAKEQGAHTLLIKTDIKNRKLACLFQKRYGHNFSTNRDGISSIKIPLRENYAYKDLIEKFQNLGFHKKNS